MGHSGEGRLLSGHAVPRWCWVTGRQIVRRTTGRCQAVLGPGPPPRSCSVAREVRVDLAGDVTLEDAHDLGFRSSFGEAARDVFAGAFVGAHAGEHDPPQRVVRLSVPAPVETMTVGLARRRFDGRDATQVRERGFVIGSVRGCRRRRPTRSRRCRSRRRRPRRGSARWRRTSVLERSVETLGSRCRDPRRADPASRSRASSRT